MAIKTRYKLGSFELDYDGSEEFFRTELLKILPRPLEVHSTGVLEDRKGPPAPSAPALITGSDPLQSSLTTRSIAGKLGARSGAQLAEAAAARLGVILGKEKFTRKELLDEVKGATGYFKPSMVGNLSKALNTLIKDGKLIELSHEVYALSADSRTQLERQLG